MTAISYGECKKFTQPGEPLQGYLDAVGDWQILDPTPASARPTNWSPYNIEAAKIWRPSLNFCQIRCLHNPLIWGVRDKVRDSKKIHLNTLETARAAWVISKEGTDFTPWSVFKSNAYLKWLSSTFNYELVTGHINANRWNMYDVPPS